jgi:spermidine synthase
VAGLRDASADAIVLDAFHGGRVPPELTTAEFLDEVARVLRPSGVFLANVADGPPVLYSRRFAATVRAVLPETLVIADPSVVKGRRFGNVVVAAARSGLPVAAVRRAAAAAPFPRTVTLDFGRDARPLADGDPMRSPQPPDEMWRVGSWNESEDD